MGKKIGLAVCYDTKNFGSQLQVLATIRKIEDLNYETEVIRYKKRVTPAFVFQTIPRLFNINFLKSKLAAKKKRKTISKHPNIKTNIDIRNKRFKDFSDTHFVVKSKEYYGWEKLVRFAKEEYDGFLCGSDQLWLPNNLGSHFYTLEFAPDNKPKIAYATSFGVSLIPNRMKKATARYLNRFESLSTREIAGQKIISELTGKKVDVVCDPTLLFSGNEWLDIVPDNRVIEESYIFCYFLGTNEEHRAIANELKAKTGFKIVSCPFLDNFVSFDMNFGDIQLFDMDASDFVNLIRHAEFVLTDSFHGSVFSILNHKKFVTFNRFLEGKNSRNSRIDSLCTVLGLSDRRYQGDIDAICDEIDYSKVDIRLNEFRNNSIDYLARSLGRV